MKSDLGLIDRLAKKAGYDISERMSFESHDSCAQRFVALVADECAQVCEGLGDMKSALAIKARFPIPERDISH